MYMVTLEVLSLSRDLYIVHYCLYLVQACVNIKDEGSTINGDISNKNTVKNVKNKK